MLDNVQRTTIEPIIRKYVKAGSTVYTDEHNIYNCLSGDYTHKTVNHGKGEYARDEDGDGKHEVHVNTMESFWSLLRPWLRRGRPDGVAQTGSPRRGRPDLIVVFLKKDSLTIWDSLNIYTISENEVKLPFQL